MKRLTYTSKINPSTLVLYNYFAKIANISEQKRNAMKAFPLIGSIISVVGKSTMEIMEPF